jgi:hypothetical protein
MLLSLRFTAFSSYGGIPDFFNRFFGSTFSYLLVSEAETVKDDSFSAVLDCKRLSTFLGRPGFFF